MLLGALTAGFVERLLPLPRITVTLGGTFSLFSFLELCRPSPGWLVRSGSGGWDWGLVVVAALQVAPVATSVENPALGCVTSAALRNRLAEA